MERISDTIQNVIQELTSKQSADPGDTPEAWLKKALTKRELGHIKFQYLRKGVLGLTVDSSSWLYSLNLKKEVLLNKLKASSSQIREIRFSIGDIK